MEQLIYQIAEQILVLHTPSARETAALLPNFAPFRLASLPQDVGVLLEVWGNEPIQPDVERERLVETTKDYRTVWRVYLRDDHHYRAEMSDGERTLSFVIDKHWREMRCGLPLTSRGMAAYLNRFILIAYGASTAKLGYLKVHASVTELRGKALLFLGVSGTGKSTHSRLWQKYITGCTLLNDDEPIVRMMPDGQVRVYGAPWSGSTPCYRNEWAEVVAFVHLYQHTENRLIKCDGREALNSLFSSVAGLSFDREGKQQIFNAVADILERIPVYHLDCRADEEAVRLTRSLLD